MDETKARLTRFINDPFTSKVVYEFLLKAFLKKKTGEDVETKAARFIATGLLDEAWGELESLKLQGDTGSKEKIQYV